LPFSGTALPRISLSAVSSPPLNFFSAGPPI
jgi:hypothetical protein